MKIATTVDQRVVDVERRTASKPHSCQYCRRPIEHGQTYVRVAVVDKGEFTVIKFHESSDHCGASRTTNHV